MQELLSKTYERVVRGNLVTVVNSSRIIVELYKPVSIKCTPVRYSINRQAQNSLDLKCFVIPGSGRITFNNQKSFLDAVRSGFIEIETPKFVKKVSNS